MKRKGSTKHHRSQAIQDVDKPEIISLEELHKQEQSQRDANREELEKSHPQRAGEQSSAGSMPNPEHVTARTTVERAKRMGVYKKPK